MKISMSIKHLVFFSALSVLLAIVVSGVCLAEGSITMQANTYSGAAHDIGIKEGRQAVAENPYFHYMLEAPVFTSTTPENFKRVSELLGQFDPPLLEEMKGFAQGASLSLEDVVVKLSGYGFTTPIFDQGCTQIAVLGGNTTDGHTLVGRNYDFTPDKKLSDFRLVILKPDSFQASIGTSQFVFGRVEGLNAAGVYAGISYGMGKGRDPNGFFFHTIVRILLDQCRTANEAVQLIQKLPHSSGYNYLIADKDNAFVVEVSPPRIAVRKAERNVIVAVNHYVSPVMKAEQKQLSPNSVDRLARAEKKAPSIKAVADMKTFLSGHGDDGVCQHYYEQTLGTIWSGIFDLTAVQAGYIFGAPCKNEIRYFDFPKGADVNQTFTGILAENQKM
jgi:predicted choloylglycine hydrolase